MAHKHDGTRYFIIIDNNSGECLYDSWADILTFETEVDAETYMIDHDLGETHHVETWLDY